LDESRQEVISLNHELSKKITQNEPPEKVTDVEMEISKDHTSGPGSDVYDRIQHYEDSE